MLASSIFVKTMIELTTGVAFLVSSLYGGGQVASPIATVASTDQAPVTQNQTANIQSSSKSNTPAQVTAADTTAMQEYLREEFGDKDAILVDIARCESNFHQFDTEGNIIRGVVNSGDIGVMQINEKYHLETAKKLGMDLYTVPGNVAYAKYLYEHQGTAPWNSSAKCWAGDVAQK